MQLSLLSFKVKIISKITFVGCSFRPLFSVAWSFYLSPGESRASCVALPPQKTPHWVKKNSLSKSPLKGWLLGVVIDVGVGGVALRLKCSNES